MAYLHDNNTAAPLNGTGPRGSPPYSDLPVAPHSIGFIFSFLAVSLNGILILVMARERKSFFNSRVSYFVVNLAVADCLTGISLAYINVQKMLPQNSTPPVSEYVSVVNWITIQSSFYTLFLMSVDRLVIVLYFKRWSNILNIRRTLISIKIVWLLAITGGVAMYFYVDETQLAVLTFVELCVVLFICNSLFIYPALRKREQGRFEAPDEVPTSASGVDCSASAGTSTRRPVAHDKMSHVVIILMIVLIVTQLPFIICFQIYLLYKVAGVKTFVYMNMEYFVQAYLYSQTWASLNFVVNPIIYAWRIRTYRKAFLNTFNLL